MYRRAVPVIYWHRLAEVAPRLSVLLVGIVASVILARLGAWVWLLAAAAAAWFLARLTWTVTAPLEPPEEFAGEIVSLHHWVRRPPDLSPRLGSRGLITTARGRAPSHAYEVTVEDRGDLSPLRHTRVFAAADHVFARLEGGQRVRVVPAAGTTRTLIAISAREGPGGRALTRSARARGRQPGVAGGARRRTPAP